MYLPLETIPLWNYTRSLLRLSGVENAEAVVIDGIQRVGE